MVLRHCVCRESHKINDVLINGFFRNLSYLIMTEEAELKTDVDEYEDIVAILESAGYNTEQLMKEV